MDLNANTPVCIESLIGSISITVNTTANQEEDYYGDDEGEAEEDTKALVKKSHCHKCVQQIQECQDTDIITKLLMSLGSSKYVSPGHPVAWYKSPGSLKSVTYNTIMLGFEYYYDYCDVYSRKKDIETFIAEFLADRGIQIENLKPKYKIAMEAEKIIAYMVVCDFEKGVEISERALDMAKSEAPELTLRIRGYLSAIFRDQGKFGRARDELLQGAEIYSSVSSYEDLCYFHFNAGKEISRFLPFCKEEIAEISRQQAIRQFEGALYFANLGLEEAELSVRDALQKIPSNCLIYLAWLHLNCFMLYDSRKRPPDAQSIQPYDVVQAGLCLREAYSQEMPILPKVYFCIGCSDYFYRISRVEESVIFAKWCEQTCIEYNFITERRLVQPRLSHYRKELGLNREEVIDRFLNETFEEFFNQLDDLFSEEIKRDTMQPAQCIFPIFDSPSVNSDSQWREAATAESLSGSLLGERLRTTLTDDSSIVGDNLMLCSTEDITDPSPCSDSKTGAMT